MSYASISELHALSFVHKRIGAAVKGFVTSGFSPTAAGVAFLGGGSSTRRVAQAVSRVVPRRVAPTAPRRSAPRRHRQVTKAQAGSLRLSGDQSGTPSGTVRLASGELVTGGGGRHNFLSAISAPPPIRVAPPPAVPARQLARVIKFAQAPVARSLAPLPSAPTVRAMPIHRRLLSGCGLTKQRDPVTGQCVDRFLGTLPGVDDPGARAMVGEAVMGRYGPALVPGSKIVDKAICLAGQVLGNDGFCYEKKSISNKERMYPAGRRPLLTGGDMRAISIATRAAAKMTRTAQRLQDIGLIQKPIVRKRRKK